MKLITLHNPTEKDIIDYPIYEAKLDDKGEAIMKDGVPENTGRTLTWSLKAGETIQFPHYVAEYLKKIYGFLKIKGETSLKEEKKSGVGESGGAMCKSCGKSFKSKKGLALHYAHSHPELL